VFFVINKEELVFLTRTHSQNYLSTLVRTTKNLRCSIPSSTLIMLFNIASALVAISSLTSLASATVMHVVTVGKDGKLAFCPESITAASGDLVQFQFYPKVSSN